MPRRTVEVVPRPEVSDDLRNLGSRDLIREALQYIVDLRNKPFLGRPLENLPHIGDLSDCRKIFFDEARYRIVYRLLPDEKNPTTVDVITVGPRAALGAYMTALTRLGRAK